MTPEETAKQELYRETRRLWAIATGKPYLEDGGDRSGLIHFQGERIEALEQERARIIRLAAEWMGDIEYAQFTHAIQADDEFLDLNLYWYREGKDNGIEQERGNIVEWLRALDPHLSTDYAAHAIEAGEHLK